MANGKLWQILLLFLSLVLFSSIFPSTLALTQIISGSLTKDLLGFDYIFQFGDSLNDVGNLRDYPVGPNNTCGGYPYGFALNFSTGRCSDGLLMIDYFAKFFHIKSPGAYRGQGESFTNGVNLAVTGATPLSADLLRSRGIDPPVTNVSLPIQFSWFKSHLNSTCGNVHAQDCQQVIRNSLIIMGEIGGNDVNFALFQRKSPKELFGMISEINRAIIDATKELINLGATRIIVPGNLPMGCLPIYLALFETKDATKYDEQKCLKYLNKISKFQNEYLQRALDKLQHRHADVAIVYGDYFSAFKWILQNASLLGFKRDKLWKSCCGVKDGKYNYDATRRCGMEGVPVCANPTERLSFDGIHLTDHAYFHMTQWLLRSIVPGILKLT